MDIKPFDLDDFSACLLYMSVKLDFTNTKYDYHTQSIPNNYSYDTFEKRADKGMFKKIASKLQYQDRYMSLLVINLYKNNKTYVRDLMQNDCLSNALHFRKYQNTPLQSFETDIQTLKYKYKIDSIDKLFSPVYNTHYFEMENRNKISSATASILNELFAEQYFSFESNELYKSKSYFLTKLYKYTLDLRQDLTKDHFYLKLQQLFEE